MENTQDHTIQKTSANTNQTLISIKHLCKSFGEGNKVLNGIDLTLNKGENLVLMGKSGSGKSVIIKCLVGLMPYDEGEVKIFDKDITNLNEKELNETRIRIGFLFQGSALYDSMSVRENLAFPLKRHKRGMSKDTIDSTINGVLDSVGLLDAIDKMPSALSGGMRKRIGLARTLILEPEIILYDEPTTGLDSITSREISELIVKIQKQNNTSSIIITHDLACAKLTGDRLAIINDGQIQATGTYEELAESKEDWVKDFFI